MLYEVITRPQTLAAIDRPAPLEQLRENIRRLRRQGNIHLHLDLIAGLPGEGFREFLTSIDRVAALRPHHLQIEPVKLLPGAPLRLQAKNFGIRFDPNPPYTVLTTPSLSFAELERLRGIGRLFDLVYNSGRFSRFLEELSAATESLAAGLEKLERFWRQSQLFRHPLSQRQVFEKVAEFITVEFSGKAQEKLREKLAHDFAYSERVV